jgi:hypothetical protein
VRNNPLAYIDPTGNSAQETQKKKDEEEEFINTEDNPEIIRINSKRDDGPDVIVMHRLLPDFPTTPYRERMMREWWKYNTSIPREMQPDIAQGNQLEKWWFEFKRGTNAGMMVAPIPGGPIINALKRLSLVAKWGKTASVLVVKSGNAADEALMLFNELRGKNRVVMKAPGVWTAKSATGNGTVTLRFTSRTGPPTVDVHGIQSGITKVHFVP